MATTDAAKIFAGAIGAMLIPVRARFRAAKAPSLFTVANVKAAAEAANAVEAKKLATQSAETRAFRLLVSRLTDFKGASRIPDLAAEQVERLVSDIEVRGEGVSGTSYVATFGVTFSERADRGASPPAWRYSHCRSRTGNSHRARVRRGRSGEDHGPQSMAKRARGS